MFYIGERWWGEEPEDLPGGEEAEGGGGHHRPATQEEGPASGHHQVGSVRTNFQSWAKWRDSAPLFPESRRFSYQRSPFPTVYTIPLFCIIIFFVFKKAGFFITLCNCYRFFSIISFTWSIFIQSNVVQCIHSAQRRHMRNWYPINGKSGAFCRLECPPLLISPGQSPTILLKLFFFVYAFDLLLCPARKCSKLQ